MNWVYQEHFNRRLEVIFFALKVPNVVTHIYLQYFKELVTNNGTKLAYNTLSTRLSSV